MTSGSAIPSGDPRGLQAPGGNEPSQKGPLEKFIYNDAIVRAFLMITVVWGLVSFLVGLIVALQLVLPALNFGLPYLSFGRLRPLHTNAAIFAFAGNAVFAAVYHSTQRLCKARIFSDFLSWLHFWGWQLIIVLAAVTLPLGYTTSKEYAELEWPIDLMIAVVWVAFAVNFFGTILCRRERHMYVALWFYIATVVTIPILHIFNSLELPVGPWKSYPVYAGVQDAFMEWWYGHNAVGFMLTTPFLGLMYYYLPKAAQRPVYSYRLSIVHFWSLVFIYIWAGPHHLHYTALPEWASTLGMLFSVMLWMPSWGGMINGLLTLRGAWGKVAEDPILKFFVVAVTFYGMSTFEGPMLSVKEVNAQGHYTDWIIAHVHGGTLGWVGFMSFGMLYWLMPRMFQAPLWSKRLMNAHFWIATVGLLLYIVPIYVAGLTQGLMWRALDAKGGIRYDFLETVMVLMPMYWIRAVGGTLYLVGGVFCGINLLKTWAARPAQYEETVHEAAALSPRYVEPPLPESRLKGVAVIEFAHGLDVWLQGWWHRRGERQPLRFLVWVIAAVIVASLFEIIPLFLIQSNIPTISSVKPYSPLELLGRDIYIENGCYNCHSQMIRPILAETKRYGEYSKGGESVYDHPFQWGSRRIGPDLAREGGKQSPDWHIRHFRNPRETSQGKSIMPEYAWLLESKTEFDATAQRMRGMRTLGVPYTDQDIENCTEAARKQADEIVAKIKEYESPGDLRDKKVIALIAYLDKLGRDISQPIPAAAPAATTTAKAP